MPEGHSIHRLALAFEQLKTLGSLRATSPQGRFAQGAARLNNAWLVRGEAWGKHLFLTFLPAKGVVSGVEQSFQDEGEGAAESKLGSDRGPGSDQEITLHVHLGLYGSWYFQAGSQVSLPSHIGAPRIAREHLGDQVDIRDETQFLPPGKNTRLRLAWKTAVADLTGPNQCELLTFTQVEQLRGRLGPDPLVKTCQVQDFVQRAKATKRMIGLVVMDQAVVAGPGNIYRAECLFHCGINPHKAAASLALRRLEELWEDLRVWMEAGVQDGRIVTTPKHVTERFYVYGRSGQPCFKCETLIREEILAGRKLFWCPKCQRY